MSYRRILFFPFALALVFTVVSVVSMKKLHTFLSIHNPIESRNLAIEGWISPATIDNLLTRHDLQPYKEIFILATNSNDAARTAEYIASRIDRTLPIEIVSASSNKNKTYNMYMNLKKKIEQMGGGIFDVNVVTAGVHARKSFTLAKTALEPDVKVGIMAVSDGLYDPERWWGSTVGLKLVARNLIGFVYAKVISFVS